MSGLELLRKVLGNYRKMLDETFESPQLKAAIAWMASQSGPPPSEVGSGALAGAHSLYHDVGATHPRGGSGMLSQALARCLEHHGGTVRCDAPVKRIVAAAGRVRGVELQNGERIRRRYGGFGCARADHTPRAGRARQPPLGPHSSSNRSAPAMAQA